MISLKGMAWDHPRGYAPLLAASRAWRETCGVEIVWSRHSLQDFEAFPVEELARGYDLMVIDHPHIGDAVARGAFAPLDASGLVSVGPSQASYQWAGRTWALPIDAAAQVQAYRADLTPEAARDWSEVGARARAGVVALPLRPPHSLMCVYTLTANLGYPCDVASRMLFDRDGASRAVEMLAEWIAHVDPRCFQMDPIAVLDAMAQPQSPVALAPLIYGYVTYARPGVGARALKFADIPSAGRGPVGSALGGAGLAVSALSQEVEAASAFASWVASGELQRGLYAEAGGQPAHADAWRDETVNATANGFFAATRATLEGAWLRPRHAGCLKFQRAASERLNQGLLARESGGRIVVALNALYADNLAAARDIAGGGAT